jgi:uncharacterized protein
VAGRYSEERVLLPMVCQRWQSLAFLHWAYDPDDVHRLLPPGLEPDVYDGVAWVGLTPFLLVNFRVLCSPPLPVVSTFPETNARTYVRDADGKDGLWFFSLDITRLPAALAARALYWVPYQWAAMRVEEGPQVVYRSRRRGPTGSGAGHHIAVRPGPALSDPAREGLVDFLTGRWRAFTRIAGRLATVPVQHQPWPLFEAEVQHLEEDLLAAAGLPVPHGPPLAHYSPGVDVRLGPPRF